MTVQSRYIQFAKTLQFILGLPPGRCRTNKGNRKLPNYYFSNSISGVTVLSFTYGGLAKALRIS